MNAIVNFTQIVKKATCLMTTVQCPENIHTHPKEGYWKFQGGGGFHKLNLLRENMVLKCNFPRGEGFKLKIFRGRGMDIFWNNTLHV